MARIADDLVRLSRGRMHVGAPPAGRRSPAASRPPRGRPWATRSEPARQVRAGVVVPDHRGEGFLVAALGLANDCGAEIRIGTKDGGRDRRSFPTGLAGFAANRDRPLACMSLALGETLVLLCGFACQVRRPCARARRTATEADSG